MKTYYLKNINKNNILHIFILKKAYNKHNLIAVPNRVFGRGFSCAPQ